MAKTAFEQYGVLLYGATQQVISRNIRQLVASGLPVKQAQAMAYKQAGRSGHRRRRSA